ncbi:hypothetical protein AOLI_G00257040 [Acnodon oligacanthus]
MLSTFSINLKNWKWTQALEQHLDICHQSDVENREPMDCTDCQCPFLWLLKWVFTGMFPLVGFSLSQSGVWETAPPAQRLCWRNSGL